MGRFSPTVLPTDVNPFATALTAGLGSYLQSTALTRDRTRQDEADQRTQEMFKAQMADVAHTQSRYGLDDAVARAGATLSGVTQNADGTITTDPTQTPGAKAAAATAYAHGRDVVGDRVEQQRLAQEATLAANRNTTTLAGDNIHAAATRFSATTSANAQMTDARLRTEAERYNTQMHYGVGAGANGVGGDDAATRAAFNRLKPLQRQKYLENGANAAIAAAYDAPLDPNAKIPDGMGGHRAINPNDPNDVSQWRQWTAATIAMHDPAMGPIMGPNGLNMGHLQTAERKYRNSGSVAKQDAKAADAKIMAGMFGPQGAAAMGLPPQPIRNQPAPTAAPGSAIAPHVAPPGANTAGHVASNAQLPGSVNEQLATEEANWKAWSAQATTPEAKKRIDAVYLAKVDAINKANGVR